MEPSPRYSNLFVSSGVLRWWTLPRVFIGTLWEKPIEYHICRRMEIPFQKGLFLVSMMCRDSRKDVNIFNSFTRTTKWAAKHAKATSRLWYAGDTQIGGGHHRVGVVGYNAYLMFCRRFTIGAIQFSNGDWHKLKRALALCSSECKCRLEITWNGSAKLGFTDIEAIKF